jgi:hypothetical protein
VLVSLASAWSRDHSGTFLLTMWNKHCGRTTALTSAAEGLVQLGVNCVVLMEVKIMNNKYPRCKLGFRVILLKVTSHSQGVVAPLWNKGTGVDVLCTA